MIKSTEEKLRQERANLWRAKSLNRSFVGDESWMPLSITEGPEDWNMFEPKPRPQPRAVPVSHRDIDKDTAHNGINGHDNQGKEHISVDAEALQSEDAPGKVTQAPNIAETDTQSITVADEEADDAEMHTDDEPTTNGAHSTVDNSTMLEKDTSKIGEEQDKMDTDDGVQDDGEGREGTPPPPTRRITRALAAEQDGPSAQSPPQSPNSTASTVDTFSLQPDPLFLLPPSLSASNRSPRNLAGLGLPIEEFLETRRLLTMYIQKQEETVRGHEASLAMLTRAKRMRDQVFAWSKTEGHVGEWSDGEDWIDAEAWGLTPEELKKGKDEEELEGQEETGRKGKSRRRRD
jgi:hypothetical protein